MIITKQSQKKKPITQMGDLNFVRKSKFQALSLFYKPQETPKHKGIIIFEFIVFTEVHSNASFVPFLYYSNPFNNTFRNVTYCETKSRVPRPVSGKISMCILFLYSTLAGYSVRA